MEARHSQFSLVQHQSNGLLKLVSIEFDLDRSLSEAPSLKFRDDIYGDSGAVDQKLVRSASPQRLCRHTGDRGS